MVGTNWSHGDAVVWRETWYGTYLEWPVRVVEDTGERIAVDLAEGTRFTFPPGTGPDSSLRTPVLAPEGA